MLWRPAADRRRRERLLRDVERVPDVGDGFNGAQVYALEARALESGNLVMQSSQADDRRSGLPRGRIFAAARDLPDVERLSSASGGTEYLLSALDFDGTLDNRIAVSAMTNTRSLGRARRRSTSTSSLSRARLRPAADATQKVGPTPFAQSCEQLYGGASDPPTRAEGERRPNEPGRLRERGALGEVETVVDAGPDSLAGVAWFEVAREGQRHQVVNGSYGRPGLYAHRDTSSFRPSGSRTPAQGGSPPRSLGPTTFRPPSTRSTQFVDRSMSRRRRRT